MRTLILLGLTCLQIGCSFDPSGITVDMGAGERGSDQLPSDVAPSEAVDVDAPSPGSFVNRGLVARYFIDEAASGTAPKSLKDSAPDPLPLTIHYDSAGSFTEIDGNRGLTWSAITQLGRASTAIDGTKILTALQGSTSGTIEMVADADEIVAGGSRFSHIGLNNEAGRFTLRTQDDTKIRFHHRAKFDISGEWQLVHANTGRTVIHLVLDTTRQTAADRARLFLDGKLQNSTGGNPPSLNEKLDLPPTGHHVLGNRENGTRGIRGTIFYAALYSTALTNAEVATNAAILLEDDDTPP